MDFTDFKDLAMKQGIHPQYNENVAATCACGARYLIGSTEAEIHVEICSACHPFFTGKQKLVDTAGRVDKFKARMAAKEAADTAKVAKTAKAKKTEILESDSNKK